MIFVLDSFLLPYLTETIAEHERRCLERMDAIIEHDDFAPMSGEELGNTFKRYARANGKIWVVELFLTRKFFCAHHCLGSVTPLSASMIAFYTVMLQFVNNICLIGSLTVCHFKQQSATRSSETMTGLQKQEPSELIS